MKVVFSDRQLIHNPSHFMVSGVMRPNPEVPRRAEVLLAAAEEAGLERVTPADAGMAPVAAIHASDYLAFLEHAHARWQRMPGASEQVTPNVHPGRYPGRYPKSATGQAGHHIYDTACPVAEGTFKAAVASAHAAHHAAGLVLDGDPAAYALCRPPGHHAASDMVGGFCYLNNAAIAAQRCADAGARVAILDVDVHHGNGTQHIFFGRDDVLTVSLHADPERYYPFFWGYADEIGSGAGEGFNVNIPLPRGTGDGDYMPALHGALERIRDFSPDIIVVALGLDAFEGDPLKGMAITTDGFARIAGAVAKLAKPAVITQEGGYPCPELGDNLKAFLSGFRDTGG